MADPKLDELLPFAIGGSPRFDALHLKPEFLGPRVIFAPGGGGGGGGIPMPRFVPGGRGVVPRLAGGGQNQPGIGQPQGQALQQLSASGLGTPSSAISPTGGGSPRGAWASGRSRSAGSGGSLTQFPPNPRIFQDPSASWVNAYIRAGGSPGHFFAAVKGVEHPPYETGRGPCDRYSTKDIFDSHASAAQLLGSLAHDLTPQNLSLVMGMLEDNAAVDCEYVRIECEKALKQPSIAPRTAARIGVILGKAEEYCETLWVFRACGFDQYMTDEWQNDSAKDATPFKEICEYYLDSLASWIAGNAVSVCWCIRREARSATHIAAALKSIASDLCSGDDLKVSLAANHLAGMHPHAKGKNIVGGAEGGKSSPFDPPPPPRMD